MTQIILFFKSLSGDTIKLPAFPQTRIQQLKEAICKQKNIDHGWQNVKLILKGKILNDQDTIQTLEIQNSDLIVYTIASKPKTVKSKLPDHPLNIDEIQCGEDFKKAVDDLVELGFKREDVIQALKHCDRNLKNTLKNSIIKKSEKKRQMLDEDNQNEQADLKGIMQQKSQSLQQNPIIKKLMEATLNSPELWLQTLLQISQSNAHIYNDIIDNYKEFMLVFNSEHKEQELFIQEDSLIIEQIQEIGLKIPQAKIIECYLENDRDPYRTINQLKQMNYND